MSPEACSVDCDGRGLAGRGAARPPRTTAGAEDAEAPAVAETKGTEEIEVPLAGETAFTTRNFFGGGAASGETASTTRTFVGGGVDTGVCKSAIL